MELQLHARFSENSSLAGGGAGEGEEGLAIVSQFRRSRLDPSTFNGVSALLDVFFHWEKKESGPLMKH